MTLHAHVAYMFGSEVSYERASTKYEFLVPCGMKHEKTLLRHHSADGSMCSTLEARDADWSDFYRVRVPQSNQDCESGCSDILPKTVSHKVVDFMCRLSVFGA